MSDDDRRFFLEHIPQSDYRRVRHRATGPNYVDIRLENLAGLSDADKLWISEKVKSLAEMLAQVLLPQELADKECENAYWTLVLAELRIS
jgi:hypothetical protein